MPGLSPLVRSGVCHHFCPSSQVSIALLADLHSQAILLQLLGILESSRCDSIMTDLGMNFTDLVGRLFHLPVPCCYAAGGMLTTGQIPAGAQSLQVLRLASILLYGYERHFVPAKANVGSSSPASQRM